MSATQTAPQFVVLHPDGRVEYGTADTGQRLRDAIAAHVPDLATQGLGRLRMWFADDFGAHGLYPNPLADSVIGRLGYRYEWYGPVALTMEEDTAGDIAPLPPEVRETITELADELNATMWTAAERHAPELLGDLMYMGTVTLDNGRTVYQYKHHDTRRYLNLDLTGQAWWIAFTEDRRMLTRAMALNSAKGFIQLQDALEDLDDD